MFLFAESHYAFARCLNMKSYWSLRLGYILQWFSNKYACWGYKFMKGLRAIRKEWRYSVNHVKIFFELVAGDCHPHYVQWAHFVLMTISAILLWYSRQVYLNPRAIWRADQSLKLANCNRSLALSSLLSYFCSRLRNGAKSDSFTHVVKFSIGCRNISR